MFKNNTKKLIDRYKQI